MPKKYSGLAGLFAALLLSGAPALAQTFELKVSHYLPPNHTFQKELVKWGDAMKAGGVIPK